MKKWSGRKCGENVLLKYKVQQFISILENVEIIEEFDIDIYFKIIEKMIVFEGNKIIGLCLMEQRLKL